MERHNLPPLERVGLGRSTRVVMIGTSAAADLNSSFVSSISGYAMVTLLLDSLCYTIHEIVTGLADVTAMPDVVDEAFGLVNYY